jgi:hypothetical protein
MARVSKVAPLLPAKIALEHPVFLLAMQAPARFATEQVHVPQVVPTAKFVARVRARPTQSVATHALNRVLATTFAPATLQTQLAQSATHCKTQLVDYNVTLMPILQKHKPKHVTLVQVKLDIVKQVECGGIGRLQLALQHICLW